MERPHRTRSAEIVLYLVVAVIFLAVCWTWGRSKAMGDGLFWDARVYAKAIAAWRAGGDPYSLTPLPFVYPPLILKTVTLLSRLFPGHTGWYLYLTAVVVSTLSLPWLLATSYLRSQWLTPVLAMLLLTFQPRFIQEQTLNTGNVALVLYAAALAAGIAGLRRGAWTWFYLVIFVAGTVKPTMLALLLLPLLAGTRQLLRSAAVSIAVLLVYGIERLSMPRLYANFEHAVYMRLIVQHDNGFGVYSILDQVGRKVHLLRGTAIETLTHCCLMALLLVPLFLLRHAREHPAVRRLWVPALLVMAMLVNPRMNYYDEIVAILPALFLWVEGVRLLQTSRFGLQTIAVALTLVLFVFTTDYFAGICLLFAAGVVLTIVAAQRSTGEPGPSLPAA